MAQTVKRLPTMRETWVQSLGWEDLLEKEMQPTPVFWPGKSHGRRNLVGYNPWGRKELDTTEHFHFPMDLNNEYHWLIILHRKDTTRHYVSPEGRTPQH